MGLIAAARGAMGGTLADQWLEFVTAPRFDEQTLIAPGVVQQRNAGRGANLKGSTNIISDGSRILVPENTALIIVDGGRITDVSMEPGYYEYDNDGQPSVLSQSAPRRTLVSQSVERFKFGGQPAQQQLVYFVNLREIRNVAFGTPSPLPYKDASLVAPGSVAPVLHVRARGVYSLRAVDPVAVFRTFLPANQQWCDLAGPDTRSQLLQEFLAAFQAGLQSLSSTTDIASLATRGPELTRALTGAHGPSASWRERFGMELVSAAVSAIEYDDASRKLLDKYNQGTLLGGQVGNAYTQTTIADAALASAGSGGGDVGMIGLAMGVGAISGTLSGLQQPSAAPPPTATPHGDPVAVLAQLKSMLDQGLISADQYATKQREVLDRM